jgi:hypothetical protein
MGALLALLTYVLGIYTVFLLVRNIARALSGRPGLWADPFGRTFGGGGGGPGGGGPGFGGGGGGGGAGGPPPPPYSKLADPSSTSTFPPGQQAQGQGQEQGQRNWGGFWTGLAAGGAAYHLLNRNTDQRRPGGIGGRPRTRIDWEDYEYDSGRGVAGPSGGGGGGRRGGEMRRATGFGSTSTR